MHHPRIRRAAASLSIALAAALALGGCASAADEPAAEESASSAATETGTFPVSIEHAYGVTELDEAPERIVTLGWIESDVVTALGHEPIAMQGFNFTDDGVSPWLDDALTTDPVILADAQGGSASGELNVEEIAALEPDLIIAVSYNFLSKFYDQLSEIAPVLGPTVENYTEMTWQEQTLHVAKALGLEEKGEELVDETESYLDDATAEHTELDGLDYTLSLGTTEQLKVLNNPEDGSIEVMKAFGLSYSESALALPSLDDGSGSSGVAKENVKDADADVVLIAFYGDGTQEDWESSPLFQQLTAVADGGYVPLSLTDLTALRNSSPLALPYTIDTVMIGQIIPAVEGD